MTRHERELAVQLEDVKDALHAISRLLADDTIAPKRRLDQIEGVIKMYGCSVLDTAAKQA